MTLPRNTADILTSRGYRVLAHFECVESSPGDVAICKWDHADPQPTPEQVTQWGNAPEFSAWRQANGGDPLVTLRRKAKEALQSQSAEQSALIRAVVIELLDYANQQRDAHNSLLTWLGSQTTLVSRNSLPAMQLNKATPAQAKTAITNRIETGEAD